MSNHFPHNWQRQIRSFLPTILIAYSLTAIVIIGISIFALSTGKRIWFFTVDPFLIDNLPSYAGILSSVGNLLWVASATVCFFSAGILKERDLRNRYGWFLIISGLFTGLLLVDGLFQMHRIFYPVYLHLPTYSVFLFYGILGIGYLIFFQKRILETEYLLLALALGFLGAAVIIDTLSIAPRGNTALSDFLKLFGIVGWFIYYIRTCWKILTGPMGKNPR